MNRIVLKELILSGKDKSDAILSFKKGLNVIAGDSDTGKTFILQCIDYALGARNEPKAIDEANGYAKITLLFSIGGDSFKIERRIGDNNVAFSKNDVEKIISCKHKKDSVDNLSRLLLSELKGDFENIYVKKNRANFSRTLSFRDLIHLVFVDESSIISETSPFQSEQYTDKTTRQSIFKYIITGVDDSKQMKVQEDKRDLIRSAAVVQYLKNRQEIIEKEIKKIRNDTFYCLYINHDSLMQIEEKIEKIRSSMADSIERLNQNEVEIKNLKRSCFEDEVQILNFESLNNKYLKELEKLDVISLYADFISQVPRLCCPVCQQAIDPKVINKDGLDGLFMYFKKRALLLKEKSQGLNLSLIDIKDRLKQSQERIKTLNKLDLDLKKVINEQKTMLSMLKDNIKNIKHLDMMKNSLKMYEKELMSIVEDIEIYSKKENKVREVKEIDYDVLFDEYCNEVKLILDAWGLRCDTGVSFNTGLLDVCVNKTIRADHGKGYRAFISAAMVIGLMRLCFKHDRLHPGFVILDSPLVSLKERKKDETGEWVSDFMEKKMIENILKEDACHQVIIVENKNIRYSDQYNYVDFRHEGAERKGFIPS